MAKATTVRAKVASKSVSRKTSTKAAAVSTGIDQLLTDMALRLEKADKELAEHKAQLAEFSKAIAALEKNAKANGAAAAKATKSAKPAAKSSTAKTASTSKTNGAAKKTTAAKPIKLAEKKDVIKQAAAKKATTSRTPKATPAAAAIAATTPRKRGRPRKNPL